MAADAVLRIQHRNIIPSAVIGVAGNSTSATHTLTVGKGLRFYVYISGATGSTAADLITLLAVPPNGGAAVAIGSISGPTAGGYLTTNGTVVADFYPGSTSSQPPPGTGSAATFSIGVLAVSVPKQWQVKITLGATGTATIAVDAEVLP
jgi:hypothetical protein